MMNYLKYIFVAAIALIAATGCQEDIEDTFSKKPTAPVLVNNGTILMTQNTMTEAIIWSWSAARFMQGEVSYTLYAKYADETPISVGAATKQLTTSMSKTNFRTLLKGFSTLSENSSFDIEFYVEATDENGTYPSQKQLMKVYSYGNAVSAVAEPSANNVVLDVNTPGDMLELLTWSPARLTYGEAITYAVSLSYKSGKVIEVAKDLTTQECTKTVDEWNELVVAAGAPEAQAADVQFVVTAFSATYPDGVPSQPLTVNIKTYKATYPAYLEVTGTNEKLMQSLSKKGLFDNFVNLKGAATITFKLKDPTTQAEYGSSDATLADDGKGNKVANGTIAANASITLPAGIYRISADIKFGKIQIVEVLSMGMIGDATPGGWDSETAMTFDENTKTYSAVLTMSKDKSYKFRANNNWGFAIDKNGDFRDGGDNYTFEKESGEYKIILDVKQHPYTAKILSTSFPEKLYIPGDHSGWAVPFSVALEGNGEGLYEGALRLVKEGAEECEWKFSPINTWGEDFAGTITLDESGYGEGTSGGGGNIKTPNGHYYVIVDMTAGTFTMRRIDKVGLIGEFNGWGGDAEFAYSTTNNVWTLTQALEGGKNFKIRFNGDWAMNRGVAAGGTDIVSVGVSTPVFNNGIDMKVAENGTYTITLDMSTHPNTIKITK